MKAIGQLRGPRPKGWVKEGVGLEKEKACISNYLDVPTPQIEKMKGRSRTKPNATVQVRPL